MIRICSIARRFFAPTMPAFQRHAPTTFPFPGPHPTASPYSTTLRFDDEHHPCPTTLDMILASAFPHVDALPYEQTRKTTARRPRSLDRVVRNPHTALPPPLLSPLEGSSATVSYTLQDHMHTLDNVSLGLGLHRRRSSHAPAPCVRCVGTRTTKARSAPPSPSIHNQPHTMTTPINPIGRRPPAGAINPATYLGSRGPHASSAYATQAHALHTGLVH